MDETGRIHIPYFSAVDNDDVLANHDVMTALGRDHTHSFFVYMMQYFNDPTQKPNQHRSKKCDPINFYPHLKSDLQLKKSTFHGALVSQEGQE